MNSPFVLRKRSIEAVLLITTMKSFNNSNIDLVKTLILVDFKNRNIFTET
ncbi:Uncharacterized protein A9P81_1579 [Leptospira interrogans serovar Copenhageni/Icterohaemorrhagiae]|nr:Uncharacterized protein A9P81_1579 [Leptospira interrogans serovar Copenhageni/Icterohaemorrhagiae]